MIQFLRCLLWMPFLDAIFGCYFGMPFSDSIFQCTFPTLFSNAITITSTFDTIF
jgi:hypothetical protein